jgi:hypothetical protein
VVALPKSGGSPLLTRLQNRTGQFPVIRLLSCLALVTRTVDCWIVRRLFVMAMSMQALQMTVVPIAPSGRGCDVGECKDVVFLPEGPSASKAASLLPREKEGPCFRGVRMCAPARRPGDPIAVIRTP